MHRLGIGLMAFGALATTALIWFAGGSPAMLVLGGGALSVFYAGGMAFLKGRTVIAERARFDEMADDVQHDARIHLLENRESELVRQVATLESRRDGVLAELAAAVGEPGGPTRTRRSTKTRTPNLVILPEAD